MPTCAIYCRVPALEEGLDSVLRLPSNPCNCVQFSAKDCLQKAILEELICESIFFFPQHSEWECLKSL